MCYVVYIAADQALEAVPWSDSDPGFYVEAVADTSDPVLGQFSKKCVYYAGSYEGCGCGFFEEGGDDGSEEAKAVLAPGRKSVEALCDYLVAAFSRTDELEMFVCWEGDQGESSLRRLEMTPGQLRGQRLPLEEKDFILLRGNPRT